VIEQLQNFVSGGLYDVRYLEAHEVIEYNEYLRRSGGYQLTKKGKLVLGELSLMLFNQFQEPLIVQRHQELEDRVREAYENRDQRQAALARIAEIEPQERVLHNETYGTSAFDGGPELWKKQRQHYELATELRRLRTIAATDYDTAITDLRLYQAQWRRILVCTLYLLSVNDGVLHKIGVTTRPIDERVEEIRADLLPHLGAVSIKVVDTWPHRGNVELYFKYRYRGQQHLLGGLTEYFKFDDPKAVIRDLRRMKPKELTDVERGVLAGELSPFLEGLRLETVEQRRRAMIRVGMEKAAKRGKHIGRPAGREDGQAFLAKPTSLRIQEWLGKGIGVRATARIVGVSVITVRKVKKLMEQQESEGDHDQITSRSE
jgi:hypothetical protein